MHDHSASKPDGDACGRVSVTAKRGVGWLTLDNPRKRNAISLAMWHKLHEALGTFAADPTIRCVVVRGAGDKAFCSGADVAEKQGDDSRNADEQIALPALQALGEFKKPTVAMVSGYCLGAGMAIGLACDLRIASGSASFGIPAARLGLAYYYSLMKRLTDVVGPANAKQMIYTADRYAAVKALQMGLVNEVVPAGEFEPFGEAMAYRIAHNAPLTIAAAKHAIETAVSDARVRDLEECDRRARACLASEDYAEGRRAFAEKRPPVFQGR